MDTALLVVTLIALFATFAVDIRQKRQKFRHKKQ
jgi:hypothetical protein